MTFAEEISAIEGIRSMHYVFFHTGFVWIPLIDSGSTRFDTIAKQTTLNYYFVA